MRKHNKTSGTKQPKGRELILIARWFLRPYLVVITVSEGENELMALAAPAALLSNKKELKKIIEGLFGRAIIWKN